VLHALSIHLTGHYSVNRNITVIFIYTDAQLSDSPNSAWPL